MQLNSVVLWIDLVSQFCHNFYVDIGMHCVGHKTDYTKVTENDCLLGYKRVLNLTKADAM